MRKLINIAALVLSFVALYLNLLWGLIAFAVFFTYVFQTYKSGIFSFFGNVNHTKSNYDKAVLWYKRACSGRRVKPTTIISYAYVLIKAGRIDEAEKVLEPVSSKPLGGHDKVLYTSNRSLILWKQGRLDEAITCLEDFTREEKNTTILGNLGYFLILKGDLDKALEANLAAYEYNSANQIIVDNLAQTYHLTGDNAKAEELYEKLMTAKLPPTFPAAYYNYGLVLMSLGKYEQALGSLKKASLYKLSSSSAVTKEQIEAGIKEAEEKLSKPVQE